MKKNFLFYTVIWAVLLAAFCAIVFLVRPVIPNYVINYDARFWVVFGCIIAAFVGNLICAFVALKEKNAQRLLFKLPLVTLSRTCVILMVVFGSVLMLIPNLPVWVAAIVCIVILAINIVGVVKAAWAAEAVDEVAAADKKVKIQTLFIKALTMDADSLQARAKDVEAQAACKKVYEAVRYSDPMSNEALGSIESQITLKFAELQKAVENGENTVASLADEVVILVGDRNKKCKLLK